jgi:uncharacterized protein with HEPN domain
MKDLAITFVIKVIGEACLKDSSSFPRNFEAIEFYRHKAMRQMDRYLQFLKQMKSLVTFFRFCLFTQKQEE